MNGIDCQSGEVLNGPTDVVLTCALVDYTMTPIEGEDRSSSDPNGVGGKCAERNVPAIRDGYEVELTLCSKIDPALMELMGVYEMITDPETGACLGYRPRSVEESCSCAECTDACPEKCVSWLVWHVAWCEKKRHPDYCYAVQGMPKICFDSNSVSLTRNSEFNTITVTGTAETNSAWGQGPGLIYPDPAGLNVEFGEWLTNTGFPGGCKCDLCGYATATEDPKSETETEGRQLAQAAA